MEHFECSEIGENCFRFINWNGVESISKYGLEVDFLIFRDTIICATTVLLVSGLLKTNVSKLVFLTQYRCIFTVKFETSKQRVK